VYRDYPTLMDCVQEFGEEAFYWEKFADFFVFNIKEKSTVAMFIKTVHTAKIQIERKMRKDLD
jgi:hypothetical protein